VLIWNALDDDKAFIKELQDFWFGWKDGAPQYRDNKWPAAFESNSPFSPLQRFDFDNSVSTNRDGILERVFSVSFISKQPQDQADIIRSGLIEILDKHSVSPNGEDVRFHYVTNLFVAKKV